MHINQRSVQTHITSVSHIRKSQTSCCVVCHIAASQCQTGVRCAAATTTNVQSHSSSTATCTWQALHNNGTNSHVITHCHNKQNSIQYASTGAQTSITTIMFYTNNTSTHHKPAMLPVMAQPVSETLVLDVLPPLPKLTYTAPPPAMPAHGWNNNTYNNVNSMVSHTCKWATTAILQTTLITQCRYRRVPKFWTHWKNILCFLWPQRAR